MSAEERLPLGPIAVIGVSSSVKKFGSAVCRELRQRGYTVYGVHPANKEFDNEPCYPRLTDIPGEIDLVVMCVKPDKASAVVEDAITKGVKRIFFQQGADFSDAIAKAQAAGLKAIKGGCIMMYAEPVGGVHAVHRFLTRIFGAYPKQHPLKD